MLMPFAMNGDEFQALEGQGRFSLIGMSPLYK
jgi:hypothetical protein